jgi:hypothetical protein
VYLLLQNTGKKFKEFDYQSDKDGEVIIENDKRYELSNLSEGSIYKVRLDDTDPYAFGMGKDWYILKRSAGYPFLSTGSILDIFSTKSLSSDLQDLSIKRK